MKLYRTNGELIGEGKTILAIVESNKVYLKWAYLTGANLGGAYLTGANLREANLREANLGGAYLYRANLEGAYLRWANLEGADLGGANLTGANLERANLEGTCLDPIAPIPETDLSAFTRDPETGELIGYRSQNQPYMGGPDYEMGKEYIAPFFSISVGTDCHPGLYLCPSRDGIKGNVIEVRARVEDTIKAGSKYRTKKFRVVK